MASRQKKSMKGVTCKNGYWYARIDGKQVYCGKGDKGRDIAIAAKAKDITRQYENKEINAGLKVKKVEFKNVLELSDWYMMTPSIQELKSYERKLRAVKSLMEYFGNKPLHKADSEEQERYRQHRKAQGVADGTVNVEIMLLSSMFHMALKRKKINADLMPGEFVKVKVNNPRRRITDEEFESILENANRSFKDVLICGYETAMRLGEICKLTAGQVHLDVQHISGNLLDYIDLGFFDTKTGARRTIPVSQRLKSVLDKRLKDKGSEDFVFTNGQGDPYSKTYSGMLLQSACKKAGIVYGDKAVNKKGERIGVVFHCLRHTRTTKWVEMGYSDEIIRRATGHRSLEAYQNYIKLDPHAVMRLVEGREAQVPVHRTVILH